MNLFATITIIVDGGTRRLDVVAEDISAIEQPTRPGDHFLIVCGGATLRVHSDSYQALRELWIARRRARG